VAASNASIATGLADAAEALLSMNPRAVIHAAAVLEQHAACVAAESLVQVLGEISAVREAARCALALLEPVVQAGTPSGPGYTVTGELVQPVEGSCQWVTF
jgi:hypothetical protein